MDDKIVRAGRRTPSGRLFRDVVERLGRDERQRVVPLPVTFAAILLPLLAAWATASGPQEFAIAPDATAREAPASLRVLDRGRRMPTDGAAYVDIYGAPEAWESELLVRRGYTSAVSSAEYRPDGDARERRAR